MQAGMIKSKVMQRTYIMEPKSSSENKSILDRFFDVVVVVFDNKYIKIERLLFVLGGLVLILYNRPWTPHAKVFSRGIRVDMPGRWMGVGFGLFFIFLGLLYKFPKKYHEEGLICPKCLTPYGLGRAPKSGKCKDCDVELEPIDGFYDRHPELRDKKDEVPEDLMDDLK